MDRVGILQGVTEEDGSAALAARNVLAVLYAAGARELVLSPGSRSAPLALAARAADQAGQLRLHVRIDERSAGFLALGLAAASGRPVPVITTSGTAVGNLLPAVMEAHHTGTQLVVLSADRPALLRGTGANQTTIQPGLFSHFATCVDLPAGQSNSLAASIQSALEHTGPVHLNLQLEAPLLPPPADLERSLDSAPESNGTESSSTESSSAQSKSTEAAGTGASDARAPLALTPGPRTVVVAGDNAGPTARILAESGGWPLLAEPTSGSRTGTNAIRTYRLLLGTALGAQIERVIVVGHPTLSRPITQLISDSAREVYAVRDRSGIATDPGRVATILETVPSLAIAQPPSDVCEIDAESGSFSHTPEQDAGWLEQWRAADARLSAAIDEKVDDLADPNPWRVAQLVAEAVPPQGLLFVGSSNPIRDLDLMAPPWPTRERRRIAGNRGLAGIDGIVSSAIGQALARQRDYPDSKAIALLGDLTFLHDSNGLLIGPDEPRPNLSFVVVNDDGGSIFTTLEQGAEDYSAAFERVFGTPHHSDLAALCASRNVPHQLIRNHIALSAALAEPADGIRVLEVKVDRADRRQITKDLAALTSEA